MINYSQFRLSLTHLEQQYRNHSQRNSVLSDLDHEGISESDVRHFKI